VGDRGDVVDAETAATFGDVHVLAAQLQAADAVARSFVDVGEALERPGLAGKVAVEGLSARPVLELAAVVLDMHAPVVGVGVTVQGAAENRLWLVPLGHADRLEPALEPGPGVD